MVNIPSLQGDLALFTNNNSQPCILALQYKWKLSSSEKIIFHTEMNSVCCNVVCRTMLKKAGGDKNGGCHDINCKIMVIN